MAKSLRSKRKKRLRTLRREIVEPFYDKKEEAKLKAQEAALSAPKLPIRVPKNKPESMDLIADAEPSSNSMGESSILRASQKIKKCLFF